MGLRLTTTSEYRRLIFHMIMNTFLSYSNKLVTIISPLVNLNTCFPKCPYLEQKNNEVTIN